VKDDTSYQAHPTMKQQHSMHLKVEYSYCFSFKFEKVKTIIVMCGDETKMHEKQVIGLYAKGKVRGRFINVHRNIQSKLYITIHGLMLPQEVARHPKRAEMFHSDLVFFPMSRDNAPTIPISLLFDFEKNDPWRGSSYCVL